MAWSFFSYQIQQLGNEKKTGRQNQKKKKNETFLIYSQLQGPTWESFRPVPSPLGGNFSKGNRWVGCFLLTQTRGEREVGKWMHLVRGWGWCYWWEPKIGDSLKSWISFCIIFFFSFLRNCLVSVSTKTRNGNSTHLFFFFSRISKKNV